jgi:hypothetical protein
MRPFTVSAPRRHGHSLSRSMIPNSLLRPVFNPGTWHNLCARAPTDTHWWCAMKPFLGLTRSQGGRRPPAWLRGREVAHPANFGVCLLAAFQNRCWAQVPETGSHEILVFSCFCHLDWGETGGSQIIIIYDQITKKIFGRKANDWCNIGQWATYIEHTVSGVLIDIVSCEGQVDICIYAIYRGLDAHTVV